MFSVKLILQQVNKTLLQSIVTPPHERNYASAENLQSLDLIFSELSSGSQLCSKAANSAGIISASHAGLLTFLLLSCGGEPILNI